ncbi:SDR family NAD(P)-dependent oxidoreductase [Novosphingobium resinovorum]|uniref:Short-chain dehydrogenase n=1 Tax=Novosphingobium resinovorum TaxID=158500 RepID=A0A1D8AEK1_9SPHN|nr:SDR family oxidoreductase [Novosphingobium resinovorum]AOR80554.1 hypothetical protein BES08_27300 [Novosphingobium resinovorum]
MAQRLAGKRVLVSMAELYMGPATIDLFEREGAHVVADRRDLTRPGAAEAMVAEAGHIDILVANLACTIDPYAPTQDIADDAWHHMFDTMVHPLHAMCRAAMPQMYARRKGKIVVFGSASGIRLVKGVSGYSAARTAQVGYVRSLAGEAAPHNVQVNLIAQHFTRNPSYFPDDFAESAECAKWLEDCPAGRLATGEEDALLALFLASDESDFVTGAMVPFTGGWHL